MRELNQEQYQVLFAFRSALRQYLQWSASHAARFGLAPQQAQLLLAIRVRPADSPPSISDLAAALQIRQHSAVGLANRAQRAGLVTRTVDPHDQRIVRIGLTAHGRSVIAQLAESHLEELQMVAATLQLSDEFLEHLSLQFAGLLPSGPEEDESGGSADDAGTGPALGPTPGPTLTGAGPGIPGAGPGGLAGSGGLAGPGGQADRSDAEAIDRAAGRHRRASQPLPVPADRVAG